MLEDPKAIAQLVKDGRDSTSYLPSSVYAEVKETSVCRKQIMKQHVRLSNQIQGSLQKFFPEYFECYADWDSTSGLMLLKGVPLPQFWQKGSFIGIAVTLKTMVQIAEIKAFLCKIYKIIKRII